MKPSLKWPLVLAALFIIVRVPIELYGPPDGFANLVSVVGLYLFVFPAVFAVQIGKSDSARPYRDQLRSTWRYALLCRIMLMPVYWLSYFEHWTARRFQYRGGGGIVGAPPLYAALFPFGQAVFWTVIALVIGGGIGCAIIAVLRRGRA